VIGYDTERIPHASACWRFDAATVISHQGHEHASSHGGCCHENHIDTIGTQTLPKAAELTSMTYFNVLTYQLSYD
jgi:hypothetical protein